jgi:hypothetical protein
VCVFLIRQFDKISSVISISVLILKKFRYFDPQKEDFWGKKMIYDLDLRSISFLLDGRPSSSGLKSCTRTYLTILKLADHALLKIVWYVLLRPLTSAGHQVQILVTPALN